MNSNDANTSGKQSLTDEEFAQKIEDIGPFWERIEFPNGKVIGPGRSKKELWGSYIGDYLGKYDFSGKTILDIGCNAGGNIVELATHSPKKIVGVDYSETYLDQARFVLEQFDLDCELVQFNFNATAHPEIIKEKLGSFDFIFCLGVVYHMGKQGNLNMLQYIRENSDNAFFSTQCFHSADRSAIDWDTSEQGTRDLFAEAGYDNITEIFRRDPDKGWGTALTNDWYFEAS